jgi:ABC-type multidrug transport system fused ATPase/permease subunit
MSSAERIFNFMNIPAEPPSRLDYDKKFLTVPQPNTPSKKSNPLSSELIKQKESQPYSFPTQGKVEFRNVFMSYREDNKPVLTGVTFVA